MKPKFTASCTSCNPRCWPARSTSHSSGLHATSSSPSGRFVLNLWLDCGSLRCAVSLPSILWPSSLSRNLIRKLSKKPPTKRMPCTTTRWRWTVEPWKKPWPIWPRRPCAAAVWACSRTSQSLERPDFESRSFLAVRLWNMIPAVCSYIVWWLGCLRYNQLVHSLATMIQFRATASNLQNRRVHVLAPGNSWA